MRDPVPDLVVDLVAELPDPGSAPRPWLATYPPGVPPTYAVPSVALPRLLDDAARDLPTRDAVVAGDVVLDHATLAARVDAVGRALITAGVRPGDVVALDVPAGDAVLPVLLWAVWRIGAAVLVEGADATAHADGGGDRGSSPAPAAEVAPAVVIATRRGLHGWRDRDERHRDHRAPRVTVRVTGDEWPPDPTPRWRDRLVPRRAGATGPGPGHGHGRPAGRLRGSHRDEPRLDELLADPAGGVLPTAPAPDAPAVVVRHGSEVRVLDHAALVATAFQARLWIPDVQAGKERVLVTDGVTHGAGLSFGLLATTLAAGALVVTDRPDGGALARAVAHHRPTILVTTAARLRALAAVEPGRHDLTSLRVVWSEDPLDAEVAAELGRRTGGARVRYGVAQALGTVTTHGQPVYGRVEPGAMGLPVTGTAAVVVDRRDPSRVCEVGEPGRLAVHGPQLGRPLSATTGDRPAPSEPSDASRWWLTDDVVTVDAAGWFRRLGHLGEVLERDGEVVLLPAVAAALATHPGVRDVEVVADPTARDPLAADPVAVVVLRRRHRPSPEELLAHCRASLPAAAVPARVVVVDELPRTPTGPLDPAAGSSPPAAGEDPS